MARLFARDAGNGQLIRELIEKFKQVQEELKRRTPSVLPQTMINQIVEAIEGANTSSPSMNTVSPDPPPPPPASSVTNNY